MPSSAAASKLPSNAALLGVPKHGGLEMHNLEGVLTNLCKTVAKQGQVINSLVEGGGSGSGSTETDPLLIQRLDLLEQDVRGTQQVQRDIVKWLEGFKGQIQSLKRRTDSQQREMDDLALSLKKSKGDGGKLGAAMGDMSDMLAKEMEDVAARMADLEEDEFNLDALPSLSGMNTRTHARVLPGATMKDIANSDAGEQWMRDRLGLEGEKELIHEDEDAFMKGVEALHEHQIEAARKMAEQAEKLKLEAEQNAMAGKYTELTDMQRANRGVRIWKCNARRAKEAKEARLRAEAEEEKRKAQHELELHKAREQALREAAAAKAKADREREEADRQRELEFSAARVFDRQLAEARVRGDGLGPAQSAEVEEIVNKRVASASADLKQMMGNELTSAGIRMAKQMEGPLATLKGLYDEMQASLASQVEQDEEHDRLFVEAFEGIKRLEGQLNELSSQLLDYGSIQSTPATMKDFKEHLSSLYEEMSNAALEAKLGTIQDEMSGKADAAELHAIKQELDRKEKSPRDLSEIRAELREMQQSANGIHGVVAAQGGQIALLELSMQTPTQQKVSVDEADMQEKLAAVEDRLSKALEARMAQLVDEKALEQLQSDIRNLCSKMKGEMDFGETKENPEIEEPVVERDIGSEWEQDEEELGICSSEFDSNAEISEPSAPAVAADSAHIDAPKPEHKRQSGVQGVTPPECDDGRLQVRGKSIGHGLQGLLNEYGSAIMLIERREMLLMSDLNRQIQTMQMSMSSLLSSAVSDDLVARVDQIKILLDNKVEAHEMARLHQEIDRVSRDYNDFTTILESTTRSVAFLDRKVTSDLDKVKESLGGLDPSAMQVQAPLMLVNSIVPHSGGCVGGYTVTVGRCSPSGRLDGPAQFQEAVPYGMACPKMSAEDREQFRRAIPSSRPASRESSSTNHKSEEEWKRQIGSCRGPKKLPSLKDVPRGKQTRPPSSHMALTESTTNEGNECVADQSQPLPPLLSTGSLVYLSPPPVMN